MVVVGKLGREANLGELRGHQGEKESEVKAAPPLALDYCSMRKPPNSSLHTVPKSTGQSVRLGKIALIQKLAISLLIRLQDLAIREFDHRFAPHRLAIPIRLSL
jgi:hypothetical protein